MLLKKITNASLVIGMTVVLSGCGSSASNEVKQVKDAKKEYGCNVINVYNAGEYIGENVNSDFEKMYNARVNYDTFESNEMMYTKLLGGSAYDVIVPSDYMIERMISEDMLQPLDKSKIPNEKDLNPAVTEMREAFDPDGVYSIPYFWGTVGLVYNKQIVDQKTIEKEGWNILRDTKYKNNIFFYDSQRDGFMVAFKALGYSMNTDDPDQIQKAYKWLRKMNETMEPAYVTDDIIDGMANYEKAIAIMYSGDAAYVLSENMDMGWIEPKQGTNKWVDGMVIPKNASCVPLANDYINYMISYNAQLANSEWVGYTPVRQDVEDYLSGPDGDYFENPAYKPRTDGPKDEVFHYNKELTRQLSDLWNKVKIQ